MKCRPRFLIAAAALSLAVCAPAISQQPPRLVTGLTGYIPPPPQIPPALGVESEPKYPVVTAERAILCTNYFAIKEAMTAADAGDKTWFEKTGCVHAAGGLRVVLIDTSAPAGLPWTGRVYPEDETEGGITAYFNSWEILAYAVATVPRRNQFPPETLAAGPLPLNWLWSPGTQPVIFKNAIAAEQWYSWHIPTDRQHDVPHRAIAESGGFRLLLGPTPYRTLSLICEDVKPSKTSSPTSCRLLRWSTS